MQHLSFLLLLAQKLIEPKRAQNKCVFFAEGITYIEIVLTYKTAYHDGFGSCPALRAVSGEVMRDERLSQKNQEPGRRDRQCVWSGREANTHRHAVSLCSGDQ